MSGFSYTIRELAALLPEAELLVHASEMAAVPLKVVAYDSRQLHNPLESLFVALKSENRDGHMYVNQAAYCGVCNFLVSDRTATTMVRLEDGVEVPAEGNYLVVPDTMAALQALARSHRERFDIPIVAITGSNGKTIVKEWLADLLGQQMQVVKSPRSYNSQLGVPLSVFGMDAEDEIGIFEAGISRVGEMEKLEAILQPQFGIMTHFGDAHAEGFASEYEKLSEKLKLFRNCEVVLVTADDEAVVETMKEKGIPIRTIGRAAGADLRVTAQQEHPAGWDIVLQDGEAAERIRIPEAGDAALENALLVVLAARHFGLGWEAIRSGLAALHPVTMRMELITDNPELAIINDAYNADQHSVYNAFSLLENTLSHPGRAVILSDIAHQGQAQERIQADLLAAAVRRFGAANVWLVGPVFSRIAATRDDVASFPDTSALLEAFDYDRFRDKAVLLKGARRFELERVIPYLSRRATATWFSVDLNALSQNFRFFRARLPANAKIMAMVKAHAYGCGSWEIAQALEAEGVDYLAVAYTSEGIALRTSGIDVPIMVMNADTQSLEQLYRYRLEPEVYDLQFMELYRQTGKRLGKTGMPVHIKVDTGMRRLGFQLAEREALEAYLTAHPEIDVLSLLSHLAVADDPAQVDFSRRQITRFITFCNEFEYATGRRPMRHLLNTAGILRFRDVKMDMVRLGIGLYGISPLPGGTPGLREIGSLHSVITQIHDYPAGTGVGYGLSETLQRPTRLATVPIGYADGVPRILSNGRASFLVRGQRAHIVGRVCMDMLMLDVTDIADARAGDEVVLFGAQNGAFISVSEIAEAAGTIPYEILTSIHQRVRRVYVRD